MTKELPLNLYSKYRYIWEQQNNTMDSLFTFIQKYPCIHMDDAGNITVSNTAAFDTCPVFCCHLDTVHRAAPDLELFKEDILMSMGGGGVGGDDKCGIVACLELLERIPCKCIFFREEERWCLGSREYDAKTLKKNAFCIEIDRRGANDLIFSASHGRMCSDEFQERVKKAFPHGEPAMGSLTDVCVLDKANINMMNLSAGYYRPHTDKEYVILSELQRNIDCLVVLAKDIAENELKEKEYKRDEHKITYHKTQRAGQTNYGTGLYGREWEDDPFDGQYGSYGADDYNSLQYGKAQTEVYPQSDFVYGKKQDEK